MVFLARSSGADSHMRSAPVRRVNVLLFLSVMSCDNPGIKKQFVVLYSVFAVTGIMMQCIPPWLNISMNNEINYKNNPLHGVSLKNLLIEIVDHYGFEILFAYLNINCFKINPSIASSVKFLKKTDWAREKVEAFYMYEFKNLPRASDEQFLLPPRNRIVPEHQTPGDPAELSLEDAERLHEKRAKKSAAYGQGTGHRSSSDKSFSTQWDRHSDSRDNNRTRKSEHESLNSPDSPVGGNVDPWAKWKKKPER